MTAAALIAPDETDASAALRAVGPIEATPVQLDEAGERWQLALDAAQRALTAAASVLPAGSLGARQRGLAAERQLTEAALLGLARETGAEGAAPWLSSVPVDLRMLSLPAGIRGCLFDMDQVLTDSGTLHAWAWSEVFDPLLQ